MGIIYIRYRGIGMSNLKILYINSYFIQNSSCIFVWNIAELAIVPTNFRFPSAPLPKTDELEM